jgi:hypothetical protein
MVDQVLTCIDFSNGSNYETLTIEWWIPMKGSKKEEKSVDKVVVSGAHSSKENQLSQCHILLPHAFP